MIITEPDPTLQVITEPDPDPQHNLILIIILNVLLVNVELCSQAGYVYFSR